MRRQIGFVLIVLVALLSIVATGGFSTAEAERGITVAVVDDDEAYLGYDEPDHTVEVNGTETVTLVKVTNRFPHDLTELATTVRAGDPVSVDNVNDNVGTISSGDTAAITGEITCSRAGSTATVIVDVTASSSETEVTLDGDTTYRRFSIECQ